MKVLFTALHFANYRNFESVIRSLAARGHDVHLLADEPETFGGQAFVERLAAEFPGVSYGLTPSPVDEPWFRLAQKVRFALDYVRFLEPRYADVEKLRLRNLERAPRIVRWTTSGIGSAAVGHRVTARALKSIETALCEVSMGGTAIGTGLNAPEGYARKCADHLAKVTGLPIRLAHNLIEATQDTQAFVLYSSCLKSLAIKLAKVGNDLRLLSSGPRCGLYEINLPAKQPGSSIMPGKVNPVIPEVTNMVSYRVIGNDFVVTMSAEAGQLQLNAFEPVIAAVVFEGQTLLINAARTLRKHCVEGITANPNVLKRYVENSIGTVTALNPVIGYERSTELAAEAMKTGQGIVELVRGKHILSDQQINEILNPAALTGQGR